MLLIFACNESENRKKVAPKDETLDLKYEVLNQLIDSLEPDYNHNVYVTTLKKVYLKESDESRPLGIIIKYDSIFLLKDSTYYKNQEKQILSFRFDKNKINKNLQYTTDEELYKLSENKKNDFWNEFHKRYGNKCIQSFSVPFFNRDRTMCVVQNSTSCGYLSGDGYTAIYKKVNGKWVQVKSFDHWIS